MIFFDLLKLIFEIFELMGKATFALIGAMALYGFVKDFWDKHL